jgi:hypothetical protein
MPQPVTQVYLDSTVDGDRQYENNQDQVHPFLGSAIDRNASMFWGKDRANSSRGRFCREARSIGPFLF